MSMRYRSASPIVSEITVLPEWIPLYDSLGRQVYDSLNRPVYVLNDRQIISPWVPLYDANNLPVYDANGKQVYVLREDGVESSLILQWTDIASGLRWVKIKHYLVYRGQGTDLSKYVLVATTMQRSFTDDTIAESLIDGSLINGVGIKYYVVAVYDDCGIETPASNIVTI